MQLMNLAGAVLTKPNVNKRVREVRLGHDKMVAEYLMSMKTCGCIMSFDNFQIFYGHCYNPDAANSTVRRGAQCEFTALFWCYISVSLGSSR